MGTDERLADSTAAADDEYNLISRTHDCRPLSVEDVCGRSVWEGRLMIMMAWQPPRSVSRSPPKSPRGAPPASTSTSTTAPAPQPRHRCEQLVATPRLSPTYDSPCAWFDQKVQIAAVYPTGPPLPPVSFHRRQVTCLPLLVSTRSASGQTPPSELCPPMTALSQRSHIQSQSLDRRSSAGRGC